MPQAFGVAGQMGRGSLQDPLGPYLITHFQVVVYQLQVGTPLLRIGPQGPLVGCQGCWPFPQSPPGMGQVEPNLGLVRGFLQDPLEDAGRF